MNETFLLEGSASGTARPDFGAAAAVSPSAAPRQRVAP